MEANQAIEYAHKCGNLTVESLVFHNNNVVGISAIPQPPQPTKKLCKFFAKLSFKLEAITRTPSVIYQNFLREFWCTAIAYDPNLPANDSKFWPSHKEYKIKYTEMNGKRPLTLEFKNFVESTGLDYNEGTYVSHPSLEVVKAELAKLIKNAILLDRTPVL
ncbi:hypothetical protein Tco_0492210 [Tanacetum coccineum]